MYKIGTFEEMMADLTRAGYVIKDSSLHTSATPEKEKQWNGNFPMMHMDILMENIDHPRAPQVVVHYYTCHGRAGYGSVYVTVHTGRSMTLSRGMEVRGRKETTFTTFEEIKQFLETKRIFVKT